MRAHELYDLGLNSQEYSDAASKCSVRTMNDQMWCTVNKAKKLGFVPAVSYVWFSLRHPYCISS